MGNLIETAAAGGNAELALRDTALVELLYGAGLRIAELVSMELDDINLDRGEARVTGKGDKERIVLFGAPCAAALERYMLVARPVLASNVGGRPATSLFLNRNGAPLGERGARARLDEVAKRAGLPAAFHPHTLRHSFATHLLDGGEIGRAHV